MNRFAALPLVLVIAACPAAPRPPAEVPTKPPREGEPSPSTPQAEAPPPAAWVPPLTEVELQALDDYAAFSADGLLYAYTTASAGAGVFVFRFQSSTTNTIEKSVALASPAARRQIADELAAEKFPRPGVRANTPSIVGAVIHDGQVLVTFSGMPAARPFTPFGGSPSIVPTRAEVAAVSAEGKRVAVKVDGKDGGEFGPPSEQHVVELFPAEH